MIPDPTRWLSPSLPKAERPMPCAHIWRVPEEPSPYPPEPRSYDYECRLCHGKQRTTRILGKCHYCSKYELLTRDHIVPRARGGVDEDRNIVLACSVCNGRKADDSPSCQCQVCRQAVIDHLAMIDAIRPFSERWAEQLTAVFFNGRAPSRSGFHSPAKMGMS